MASPTRSQRRELDQELITAASYEAWHAVATELDRVEENDAWRAEDESPLFDAALIRRHTAELAGLRRSQKFGELESTLTESLYRNLAEVTSAPHYEQTHTGEPKHVVRDWLDECVTSLETLRDAKIPGLDIHGRRAQFARALENLGHTALMLSGGGSWGLYHLGVVKALKDADLLPTVICGSSMGAIVASGIGVRTDEELDELFAAPERIHRIAVRLSGPRRIARKKSLLNSDQLAEHVQTNVGDWTFGEAFDRTGRVLNVSVSPTRARQKPRVLSYRTAPDVLVSDATQASCAIPGLFSPVALRQRTATGETAPYVATEKWVDGSLRGDLPLRRMGRLHNVNHFVVSQANPFVLPFVTRHRRDPATRAARFAGSILRASTAAVLDETRRRAKGASRPWLDAAHALTAQHYGGDIDIHPRVQPTQFFRLMSNPSLQQLRGYILGGEQATWPHLAVIRDQTRISRALQRIVAALDETDAGAPPELPR
jgi:NTE family protein